MKLRMEVDPEAEEELVLYCREITPDIMKLQQILAKAVGRAGQIILYKGNTEYYTETDKILFF